MKLDPTVKKETLYLIIGEGIMTAVMLVVFLLLSKFSVPVLIGSLVGATLAIGNFFAMCLMIQRAVEAEEGDRAKMVRASHSTRLMVIALALVICLAVFKLDVLATLIPLLFPTVIQYIRGFTIKNEDSTDK